jgi:hypothetical protein
LSADERAKVQKLCKEKKAKQISAAKTDNTQTSTPKISAVAVIPLVKPSVSEIVVPKDVLLIDDKETTPIISNVSFKNPSSDPDLIRKAVAASRYEASCQPSG